MRIKILAALSALALALGMVAVTSASASATRPTVNGVAVCNTTTGLFDIAWTVGGDVRYDLYTATVVTQSAPTDPSFIGQSVKGESTVTAAQNGVAAGTYSLTIKVQWTNHNQGDLVSQTGTVVASGQCDIPKPLDASASATPVPPTCDAPSSIKFSLVNATWEYATDITDGSRKAIADKEHLFPGGVATIDVGYDVTFLSLPKLTGAQCQKLVTPPALTATPAVETCNAADGEMVASPGSVTFPVGDWTWQDSEGTVVKGTKSYIAGSYVFTVHATSGFKFDDQGATTKDFPVVVGLTKSTGPCLTLVTPVTPKVMATDVCGTANDTLTVDSTQPGVLYTLTWNGDRSEATVAASVTDAAKYYFDTAAQSVWNFPFTDEPCEIEASIAPTATAQQCLPGQTLGEFTQKTGGVTVGLDTNLEYTITGTGGTVYGPTVVTAAFTKLEPGDYTVSVAAMNGLVLAPGAASQWPLTIKPSGTCSLDTHPLISTTATSTAMTCASSGSYTLANTEGVVWYTVANGVKTLTQPGTYKVNTASTVKVHADVVDSTFGWESDAKTDWTFNFTADEDCLPTLAFTGSTTETEGLLLAGIFLLLGGAIVAFERRFRTNLK